MGRKHATKRPEEEGVGIDEGRGRKRNNKNP